MLNVYAYVTLYILFPCTSSIFYTFSGVHSALWIGSPAIAKEILHRHQTLAEHEQVWENPGIS